MSQLLLTLLQLGFLVLLWALVMAVIGVLRTDIYGTRLVTRGQSLRGRGRSGGDPSPTPSGGTARRSERKQRKPRPSRLVVTEGPLRGTIISLTESAVVIGRASDSTLVLDDDFASARHARLTPGPEGWVVEDLGSTNGTRVNGQALEHPAMAVEGTSIQIGKTALELRR